MRALVSRRRMLQLCLGTAAAVAVGVGLDLAPPAPGARVLSAHEMAIAAAIAEVMFPAGAMPLDGIQAQTHLELDRVVALMMDPNRQKMFRYVLHSIETGTRLAYGAPFSALSSSDRLEVLNVWADPHIVPRRLAFDAVKLVFGIAYFRHPAVIERIGWRTGCRGDAV